VSLPDITGQNPFDIKAPNNKAGSVKVQDKSKPPTPEPLRQEAAKQEPHKEKQTVNPAAQAISTPTASGNVFDIKPGPGSKVVIQNKSETTEPKASSSEALPSSLNKDSTTLSTPGNSGQPADGSTNHGLQDVKNPFNIVPPQAGNPSTIINPPTDESSQQVIVPDLNQIKSNLDQFKDSTTKEKGTISKNAWFIIYIFLGLLAAVAINFNRSYPMALIKATYNQNQLRILFKDAFKGNHVMIFGILYLLFVINGGIFLYQSFRIFELGNISLLLAIGIVLIVYFLRHLVLFVLGIAFPLTRETLLFSYTIGIHNLALGLALMLINILLSFVDPETGKMLIFSGLSIILAMYLLRQVRGLLNNMPVIISGKFHFIIYLCTVEIAPWLLLTGILLK
jgi:hypothetical protein